MGTPKVYVWSMDIWSGRNLERVHEFETFKLAAAWVIEFNSKNDLPNVPDYYEYAELIK